jgi:hypothetical protein
LRTVGSKPWTKTKEIIGIALQVEEMRLFGAELIELPLTSEAL